MHFLTLSICDPDIGRPTRYVIVADSFYKEWTSYFLDNCVLNSKPVNYNTNEQPRFWFEPRSVWEIRGADLSVSPMHCAAFGQFHQSRGVALRFPRFIRVRDDKAPEDATPVSEIVRLFSDQQRRVGASIEEKPLAQDPHNGESGSDE
jgi:DNA ligase-1